MQDLPELASIQSISKEVPRFDFSNSSVDPAYVADILTRLHKKQSGYGLSANQFNLPYRAFICGVPDIGANIIMFNPVVVYTYGEEGESTETEACLSFPDLFLKITRPTKIRVRYQDANGTVDTNVFSGLTARVIQHEIDHLNGISFTSRVSRLKLDIAKRKAHARKHKSSENHRIEKVFQI